MVSDFCHESWVPVTSRIGTDFARQGVWRGLRVIPLSARKFVILAYLARHSTIVIPTESTLSGWMA